MSHKNIERHTAHTIVSWPNPNPQIAWPVCCSIMHLWFALKPLVIIILPPAVGRSNYVRTTIVIHTRRSKSIYAGGISAHQREFTLLPKKGPDNSSLLTLGSPHCKSLDVPQVWKILEDPHSQLWALLSHAEYSLKKLLAVKWNQQLASSCLLPQVKTTPNPLDSLSGAPGCSDSDASK